MKTETPDETPQSSRKEIDHEMEGFQRCMDDRPLTRKEFDREMEDFRQYILGCVVSMINKVTGQNYCLKYDADQEPVIEAQAIPIKPGFIREDNAGEEA